MTFASFYKRLCKRYPGSHSDWEATLIRKRLEIAGITEAHLPVLWRLRKRLHKMPNAVDLLCLAASAGLYVDPKAHVLGEEIDDAILGIGPAATGRK